MTARPRVAPLPSLSMIVIAGAGLVVGPGCGVDAAPVEDPAPASAPSAVTPADATPRDPDAADAAPDDAGPSAPPPANTQPQERPSTRPAPPVEPPAPEAPAADRTTALFDDLLGDVVTEDGLVRYDVLKKAEHALRLATVIDGYARGKKPDDKASRLAIWCNAYNANVLASVLFERRKPGFVNVVEVEGFFDRPITVFGESLTLNELENKRIRPEGDARIHAALACAAVSCPPLRAEAYTPGTLDRQLDDQCRRWVNDPTKFRVVDGTLGLSQILKWYGDDFRTPPYGSPAGFVLAYAATDSALARLIVNEDDPKITWLKYDWALNIAPRRTGAAGG